MGEEVLLDRYRITRLLGSGAFAQVYEGISYSAIDQTTNSRVAVKLEDLRKRGTAQHEAKLLQKKLTHKGIPVVKEWKRERDRCIVVMELLGPSIFHLVREKKRRPTTDTLYRVMYQTLKILRYTHRKGYVHTDIKPDNILLGLHSHHHLTYLIDFCESRKYSLDKDYEFVGNPYFSSTSVLEGSRYGPKDDLEALAYIFGFMHSGSLPWSDFYDIDPCVCIQKILEFRRNNDIEVTWRDLPGIIPDLVLMAQGLDTLQIPDYAAILTRIRREAEELGVNLRSKTPIWDLERPQIRRMDTLVVPLGTNIDLEPELLIQIRKMDKPPEHSDSNAPTVDSVGLDSNIATIVTGQLPTMSRVHRTSQ